MQDLRAIPKDHEFSMVALLADALTPFPWRDDAPRPQKDASPSQRRRIGWLARLDRWLWASHQRAFERYLAESQDVFELERRIRAFERGVLHRYL